MANKTKLKKANFGKVKIIYFKMINQREINLFWVIQLVNNLGKVKR